MNAALPLLASGGLWPTISLVIFFSLFVAIVIYVFVVPTARWRRDSELPLDNPTQIASKKENSRG